MAEVLTAGGIQKVVSMSPEDEVVPITVQLLETNVVPSNSSGKEHVSATFSDGQCFFRMMLAKRLSKVSHDFLHSDCLPLITSNESVFLIFFNIFCSAYRFISSTTTSHNLTGIIAITESTGVLKRCSYPCFTDAQKCNRLPYKLIHLIINFLNSR